MLQGISDLSQILKMSLLIQHACLMEHGNLEGFHFYFVLCLVYPLSLIR